MLINLYLKSNLVVSLCYDVPRERGTVVAQLAERSLLTPEIRISNPIIGKILSTICTIKNKKVENEEKEEKKSVMAHL